MIEAEKHYRSYIQHSQSDAYAYNCLGVICSLQNKHEQALTYLSKACLLAVSDEYFNNLGKAQVNAGKAKDGIKSYIKALKLNSDSISTRYNYAIALGKVGKLEESISQYQRIAKKELNHYLSRYNWANTLVKLGRSEEAISLYEEVIALNPSYDRAYNNLGLIYQNSSNYDQAIYYYEKSIEKNQHQKEAYKNLVTVHSIMCNVEQTTQTLLKWAAEVPGNEWIKWEIRHVNPTIFNSINDIAHYRSKLIIGVKTSQSNPPQLTPNVINDHHISAPFICIYQGQNDLEIRHLYGTFFENYFKQIRPKENSKKSQNTVPHIGFVVTSGHEGVFFKCMGGVIKNINKKNYNVSIVCQKPTGFSALKPLFDDTIEFVTIPESFVQSESVIRGANFDLLHYWEIGTDSINYFLPFLKLAPIQCTSWGWPVTSGIPTMDYYISSKNLEPENAQEHYSEELVLLDRLPTFYYQPEVNRDAYRLEDYNLPEGKTIYLCNQNLRKIHPDMDEVFSEILTRDENGIIVFIKDKIAAVTDRLKERLSSIANADKVLFVDKMSQDKYLTLLTLCNVILDTFHYTGGANTSYDAFACAKPYITFEGKLHKGKYGTAAYKQIGVTDCIATDQGHYINLAIKVANNQEFHDVVSEKIASNSYKVFEDNLAIKEFENFLVEVLNPNRRPNKPPSSRIEQIIANNKRVSKFLPSIETQVDTASDAIIYAQQLIIKKENERAIDVLENALKKFPQEERLSSILSLFCTVSWKLKKALTYTKPVLNQSNCNSDDILRLAYLYLIQNDKTSYHDTLKSIPNNGQEDEILSLYSNLYVPPVYSSQDDHNDCVKDLKIGLKNMYQYAPIFDFASIKKINWWTINFLLYQDGPMRHELEKIAGLFTPSFPRANRKRKYQKKERIRIGYVVTNGHEGIFIRSMFHILLDLNKERFKPVIMCHKSGMSEFENLLKGIEGIAFNIIEDQIDQAIVSLSQANFDIIHHWEIGSDVFNYILPFYRLAPVQCSSWGIPMTSGIPNMDYFISSQRIEPENGQDHYSEELILFKNIPTIYQPIDKAPLELTRQDFGLPADGTLYFCNQRLMKIHPGFDKLIDGILMGDKANHIVLLEDRNEYLKDKLDERFNKTLHEEAYSRLHWLQRLENVKYLQLIELSDVILDTPLYNGANTLYDSFSYDRPVVTMRGEYHRARFAAALYSQMGVENLVSNNDEEYIETALKLGTDKDFYNQMSQLIRENKTKLWMDKSIVSEYEEFYVNALQKAVN